MKKYDYIIIGFGKAGKTLASYLGSKNFNVALIEKSKSMYGGTCINIGCIPTKILVEEANHSTPYKEAIERKNNLISLLRDKNYEKLVSNKNVTLYNGIGSFISKNEIKITSPSKEKIIFGDTIFINTGAESVIPSIEGIDKIKNIYTSATLMEVNELPKSLAIIGGGYIGLEFASIYNTFGSKITILENGPDILLKEEPEIQLEIKTIFKNRDITILTDTTVVKLEQNGDSVKIYYRNKYNEVKILEVSAILVATGRKANIKDLNLEAAGINFTDRGIDVDKHLKTNIDNIFALGDVAGHLQFTYISLDDFRIVKNYLFGDKTKSQEERDIIPYSVFISPTLSRVGLSEKEAIKKGYNVKTNILKVNTIPRAKILKSETGIFKAVVDSDTNKILGCTLLGELSSEIINIVTLAIKENKTFEYLQNFIFTHPSMSESLNDLFSF